MRSLAQLVALVTPKKRIKPNVVRQAANFVRQYLSVARVQFVQSLPCAACGIEGYSENAHLLGNDGAGRKGPYTEIGPLCGFHPHDIGPFSDGCHRMYDRYRSIFDAHFPDFKPELVAQRTERAWQLSLGNTEEP